MGWDCAVSRSLSFEVPPPSLTCRPAPPPDPYDRFEVFLDDWEPAVGTVAYWWTLYDPTKFSIHHNNDAVFSGAPR